MSAFVVASLLLISVAMSCGRSQRRPVQAPAAPLPPTSGTLAVEGLTAPVQVARDRWGIPHTDQPLTVGAFKRLQHDTYAWNADRLVLLLARVSLERADVEDARQRLLRWNREVTANSADAALYVAWERALTKQLLALKMPSALIADLVATESAALVPALVTPSRAWFGD